MSDETLDDTTIARTPVTEETAPAADDTDTDSTPETPADDTASDAPVQYGIGPFSLREVILGGVWLVAFVVSFFPINIIVGQAAVLVGGPNVWMSGLSWILAIGLPTVAVFLLALRRLSPSGIRRVGSLGIDQFASVAFSVSAITWVAWVWDTAAVAIQIGVWARSWVIWVEAVLMLAGVVLTVFAVLIPGLADDFRDRPESVAHRNARAVRPVTPRPVRERPAPVAAAPAAYAPPVADTYDTGTYDTGAQPAADPRDMTMTDAFAPLHTGPVGEPATQVNPVVAEEPAPAQQAFWALVPVERDVVDDYGQPLFRIAPTAWALVIEDRGEVFVIRHEDGRIGYLHDVSGVTRG